jgi:hypothetical protein
VIRAFASGAGVLSLDSVDEMAGELEVVGPCDRGKICCEEPSRAWLAGLPLDVARELTETLVGCRLALA